MMNGNYVIKFSKQTEKIEKFEIRKDMQYESVVKRQKKPSIRRAHLTVKNHISVH